MKKQVLFAAILLALVLTTAAVLAPRAEAAPKEPVQTTTVVAQQGSNPCSVLNDSSNVAQVRACLKYLDTLLGGSDPGQNGGGNPSPTGSITSTLPVTSTGGMQAPAACSFPAAGNLDAMPKTMIELAAENTWFHRVFNPRLFVAPNWDGADSWFVSLALGQHSGGNWTSHGNPGQVVHRGVSTHQTWCLGVLTTSQWKSQFMGPDTLPAAINVRIAPNSLVTVKTAQGTVVSQATSDAGDITIILPDNGVVTIAVDYTTAAPTHESLVWWGPYDRSEHINTVDAR